MIRFLLFLTLAVFVSYCFLSKSRKPMLDFWKSKTVYQLLTDRYARNSSDTSDCKDLSKYCGGTFKGIVKNLDYIMELGFDAIWISPVVDNVGNGYHGYHARDWTKINSNFGTKEDLKELVEACHKNNISVMVDVVANHVGPVDVSYQSIFPFNKAEYYHDYCIINQEDWGKNQVIHLFLLVDGACKKLWKSSNQQHKVAGGELQIG